MGRVLEPVLDQLEDPDAIVFAIAYHDMVYKVTRSDNELQSAEVMKLRLGSFEMGQARIDRIARHILATRSHEPTLDHDTAFLSDADLSVLGADPETYLAYAAAVRKEYRRFPDLLYRPGRRKVLRHFLDKPFIYQTSVFKDRWESTARRNLTNELRNLG
jgi:predicted metal-dependent HD superfamily phosphohydrolase